MSWNKRYWDIIEQIYWQPSYSGMKSIPKELILKENGRISIPEENLSKSGSIYARHRNYTDFELYMNQQEEILNHLFDITFSIASDDVIRKTFFAPLGLDDTSPCESWGREVAIRYGWGRNANVTQHDGYFVSDRSVVAVELKLGSPSSPEQIMKYAAMMAWEELTAGPKENLGLLFILPKPAISNHWPKCGLTGPKIDGSFVSTEWKKGLNRPIERLIVENKDVVVNVLDRMILKAITWEELWNSITIIRSALDVSKSGDKTLDRLLSGFLAQLSVHGGTALAPNAGSAN